MRYKTPKHVRGYVKKELFDYRQNKKILSMKKGDTHTLLIAAKRVECIETVFLRLDDTERRAAELIFFEHATQARAEFEGIGKGAYYNTMNKVIYLTAKEMELL